MGCKSSRAAAICAGMILVVGFKVARSAAEYSASVEKQDSASAVVSAFNDGWLSMRPIHADSTGNYIEIDDMRFRVVSGPGKDGSIRTLGLAGRLWPNGTLGYKLSPEVKAVPFDVSQFKAACGRITSGSGIGCFDVEAGNTMSGSNFVYVTNDSDNYSYVGWQGGSQLLGIHDWQNQIVIAHEIKHALGWVHEHQRPDRDQFVVIRTQNIEHGQEQNFAIVAGSTHPTPYDFDSIMHYGATDFSANGNPTIDPRPGYEAASRTMGQRDHLSAHELEEIIAYYGDSKTRWCGQHRIPSHLSPGCFYDCIWADDPAYAQPEWCGTCQKPGHPCR